MKKTAFEKLLQFTLAVLICSRFLAGCAIEQRDEIVAGVAIPIPGGMSKAANERLEVIVPGFGGAKVAYRGNVDPDEVLAFYQKELPARGWKSNASLVTRGGVLAYTKDNKNLLITVSPSGGATTLGIVVGSINP